MSNYEYRKNIEYHKRFDELNNTFLRLCIIKHTNAQNLTADIFVPATSTNYFDIPLLMLFLSSKSGAIILPKDESPALMLSTFEGKKYVLTSLATFVGDQKTYLVNGENKISNESRAMLKQDIGGGNILISSNTDLMRMSDGEYKIYSPSFESVSSVKKEFSAVTNIQSEDGSYKGLNYSEISSSMISDHIYSEEDLIIDDANGIIGVDETKRETILDSADLAIKLARSFGKDVEDFRSDILENPYADKHHINDIISDAKNKLTEKFSRKKDVCIIKEEGMAIKSRINSLNDIDRLTVEDIELTSEGKNIVFRMRAMKNGAPVASIQIDEDGVIKVKCKDMIIEKEVM